GQLPAARDVVVHASLVGDVPRARELQLERALPAVQVRPGADLEPVAPALPVLAEGEEVGRVEVGGRVAEPAEAADVQRRVLLGEPQDHRLAHGGGHQVLVVDPGLQLGPFQYLGKPDRRQCGGEAVQDGGPICGVVAGTGDSPVGGHRTTRPGRASVTAYVG